MLGDTLDPTNFLLGILVVVSVLEGVALVAVAVMMSRLHKEALGAVRDVQAHLQPLVERVNGVATVFGGVAADMKQVTARTAARADQAGLAIQTAVGVVRLAQSAARWRTMPGALPIVSVLSGISVAYGVFTRKNGPSAFHSSAVRQRRSVGNEPGPAPAPRSTTDTTEVFHGART